MSLVADSHHALDIVCLGHTRIHVKTRVAIEMSIFVKAQIAAGKVGNAAVPQYLMFTVSVTGFLDLRLNVGGGCEHDAEQHPGEE
jgi:hypothetical protein